LQVYTNNTSPTITQAFNTHRLRRPALLLQVQAVDPDGDRLAYSLDQPPAGLR